VQEPQHYSAHVVSVAYSGGEEIIVHLDNEQVWEQSGPASARLYLRRGDAVEINHALGSWWLSGQQGDAIKVRRSQ